MTCGYDMQLVTPVDFRLTAVGKLGGKEAFSSSAEIQELLCHYLDKVVLSLLWRIQP